MIFLSEAFTRPKMMYRLAKVGFSQSYTYFTWRNTKQELIEYFTELTTTDVKDYFRPHLFVNTPDINPYFLQTSGRPGFLIRAALAATLSGLWGVYSGFRIVRGGAFARPRGISRIPRNMRSASVDFDAPGNIIAEIAKLNRISKEQSGAAKPSRACTSIPRTTTKCLFYGKTLAGPRRHDPGSGQSRSASTPMRSRSRCHCGNGSSPTNALSRCEDLDERHHVLLARQVAAHPARPCNDLPSPSGASRRAPEADVDAQVETAAEPRRQTLWYKDAIIYQLHVKSFFDSNDDGIGDFPGLDLEARLHRRSGRQHDLAVAVLSVAAS